MNWLKARLLPLFPPTQRRARESAGLPGLDCQERRDRRTKPGMAPNPNIAPVLFDRALLRARQSRALGSGPATFLLDRVAEDMAERLHAVLREFKNAADVGTPNDRVSDALLERVDQLARIDLPDLESEPLPLQPESLDLILSALAFQFINDLPGVLAQIRRALRPDGLFLAAMIGGDTLTELRQSFASAEAECEGGVSPRVALFADLRDIGALLQRAGFALPVTDVDRLVVRYASPFALMDDLRRMGATNALSERLEHARLDGREIIHQLVELAMPDHHQPRRAHRPRGGGARLAVNQRDLAQEVALAKRGDDRSVDVYLDRTVEHHEELFPGLSLARQQPAVDDIDLVRERSQLLEVAPAETGEEGHALELLELLVGGHRAEDIARDAGRTGVSASRRNPAAAARWRGIGPSPPAGPRHGREQRPPRR